MLIGIMSILHEYNEILKNIFSEAVQEVSRRIFLKRN